MSKTVKIILIVAVVLIIGGVCACVAMTGGIFTLAAFLPTSTPTPSPVPPTPLPTSVPPTATASAAGPSSWTVPNIALRSPKESFKLNGVDFNLYDVRYSLINGGEDAANYISSNDGFLFVVTLGSNEKDLKFVYDKYVDSMRLVDMAGGEPVESDWMNWSSDSSTTNSGYVKISFRLTQFMRKPALFFDENLGIDMTPILPASQDIEDPWWEPQQQFDVNGTKLRMEQVILTGDLIAADGTDFKKNDPANKILTIQFLSPTRDLSHLKDWYVVLIDPADINNPYYSGYVTWTTGDEDKLGVMETSFEVPPAMKEFILFIPFDNLMDLTSMVVVE